METLRVILLVVVIFVFVTNVNAETDIPDDDAFQAMFVGGECNFNTGNDPYNFGVGQAPLGTTFFIEAGDLLTVAEGVEIRFAANVELIVDGEMFVSDENALLTVTIEGVNGARWNSIVIRGEGGDTGVGVFYDTDISGGGSEQGHGGLFSKTRGNRGKAMQKGAAKADGDPPAPARAIRNSVNPNF